MILPGTCYTPKTNRKDTAEYRPGFIRKDNVEIKMNLQLLTDSLQFFSPSEFLSHQHNDDSYMTKLKYMAKSRACLVCE